jgi:hypothetical protein
MSEAKFRYISTAHSAAGSGVVAIRLQREGGDAFFAILSADDAKRLSEDLPEQARIAAYQPPSRGQQA